MNRLTGPVFLLFLLIASAALAADRGSENVFLITTDGLRWEEVFQGADEVLISKEYGGVGDTNALRAAFWRETAEERREALLPFLWGTIAKKGQLWGNRDLGSSVRVTNGRNFSYPGYNEFLTGYADPEIDSNNKVLNSNTNVFEWLNSLPAYKGRVAAVLNWDVLTWVLNGPRASIPIWSGFEVPDGTQRLEVPALLTELVDYGRTVWPGVLLDTFVGSAARHAVRTLRPRALYVAFGETDDWAHEGRYDRYLNAAHQFDRFLRSLWELADSTPEYRGRTTFLISVDHGRGPAPIAWKNHGAAIPPSAYIWFAAIGPDIRPLGERKETPLTTQAQIAATVADLLGEDFHRAHSKSAPPIPGLADGQL
jgi:hypothetical protein